MNHLISMNQFKAIFGESIVACIAATLCAMFLNVPVWAMFIGWIAFFTRGITTRDWAINMICVFIGLVIGIVAGLAGAALEPALGTWSITPVVLMVTMVVLCLQVLPVINNVLAFFLGLVCFFASQLPPTLDTFVELGTASALGVTAGLMASLVKKHYSGRKANSHNLDKQISLPD
ncbi:DUF1097 domain-containing protein [Pseudomonas fluorescens]|uniref:DUF1097 domain-containing protein n=1 Tax=Pseudomonas fluorescens TaxID=294 RepID=A0A5E7A6F3_PSEFL|nr:DUF1097 domain-containing protein [Pseudomonas fluorescens]VVN71667.1 hypothetical protein PS710_00469 [Pseudomonas fluorescens]